MIVGADPIVSVDWEGQGMAVGKAERSVAVGSFGHTVVDDNLGLGRAVGSGLGRAVGLGLGRAVGNVGRVDGCCNPG